MASTKPLRLPVVIANHALREAFPNSALDSKKLTTLRGRLDREVNAVKGGVTPAEHTALFTDHKGPKGRAMVVAARAPSWSHVLFSVLMRAIAKRHLTIPPEALARLPNVLASYDVATLRPLLGAAIRIVVGRPMKDDLNYLDAWVAKLTKETSMATTFYIDSSSIPVLSNTPSQQAYLASVKEELQSGFGLSSADADPGTSSLAATLTGMAILDGEYLPGTASLKDALRRAWIVSLNDFPKYPSGTVKPRDVFAFIVKALPTINGNKTNLSYQEIAYVAREVIASSQQIQFDHPNFMSAVRIAFDKYVETRATGDSLTLPPGSLPGSIEQNGGDPDLNADNIRVTGVLYAMSLFERTLIFKALDRVTETFMIGLQPFGQGAAGRALDEYYWNTEDRLTEGQRRSVFSRVLGMPGGEVSKEVQPNKDFESLFLRFISCTSEFTRQREVDRMFYAGQQQRPVLSMTGEQVRKAALDLAKNSSLYSWGGSIFIAQRMNQQLQRAIAILSMPEVLKAYSASNHWQVVERVSQQDFGGTANWVKFATMAKAASDVFGILAANTSALSVANSSRPFLYDPSMDVYGSDNQTSDLDKNVTQALLIAVQQWLAVNGVGNEQLQKYSQPVEIANIPGLPAGTATKPDGADVVNKLKQLVAGGSTPSADQLQQLLTHLQ